MGADLSLPIPHLVEDAGERPIARQEALQAIAVRVDLGVGAGCHAENGPSDRVSEIEREGILDRALERGQTGDSARRVAMILKSRAPASLCLGGIDRQTVVAAAARMPR